MKLEGRIVGITEKSKKKGKYATISLYASWGEAEDRMFTVTINISNIHAENLPVVAEMMGVDDLEKWMTEEKPVEITIGGGE
ncbi:MAG: hypothetical protein ACXQTD_05920 [Candidatus Syntropharchaeia archaeon]